MGNYLAIPMRKGLCAGAKSEDLANVGETRQSRLGNEQEKCSVAWVNPEFSAIRYGSGLKNQSERLNLVEAPSDRTLS